MRKSKAALFLMELLIVLLFFSIACAVCLQLFSHAHLTNKKSQELSDCNVIFTGIAEDFYAGVSLCDSDLTTISYNRFLEKCDNIYASYTATIRYKEDSDFSSCHISVSALDSNTEFISEDLVKYERRTLGDE